MIAIIDYGMGNLHSVAKAVEHVGGLGVCITNNAQQILAADRIIFPGVGAIGYCLAQIDDLGLREVITQVSKDRPFLGICVGMQSLFEFSEESGGVKGLNILRGTVKRFVSDHLKIPHMGWNQVKQNIEHPLWHKINDDEYFYFVHSYYVANDEITCSAGSCAYGITIGAAVAQDYIFAVQFHPEKSHNAGLQLLKNFIEWK